MKETRITSYDGTVLASQEDGSGEPWILANGLGGTFPAWKLLVEEFRDRYKFITWDYRGLFGSETPADPEAISIYNHASDMESVMDIHGVKKAVIAGWSMGAEVVLEFASLHPERVKAIILFNGTYGSALNTVMGIPGIGNLVVPLNDIMAQTGFFVGPVLTSMAGLPFFLSIMQFAGFIDRHFDRRIFREVLDGYTGMDFKLYARMLRELHNHKVDDILREIAVPILFVHGEKDLMTPLRVAKKAAALAPRAEFFTVPFGSHYCLLEFPEIIHMRVDKFLTGIE